MIRIHNCNKNFKKIKAINNFSVNISQGVYGLLGSNGAGKTTLMRCICGLYQTDSGKIETDIENIGYLPQKFGMFRELTVREMMEYFATLKKIDKSSQKTQIEDSIEKVNLSDRIEDRISTLSGGMVRRVGIAQAILGNPQVVLFDEPTAGLDPEERLRFKNVISRIKKDCTVIISTHIVSDIESTCDKVLIMDHGSLLAEGTTSQIAEIAENKVYFVNEENENNLSGNYYIVDKQEVNGEIMMRVLSDEKQNGELQKSTIEDGYLCCVKKI